MFGGYSVRSGWLCLVAATTLWANVDAYATENPAGAPGCANKTPQQCVVLALDAMGGRDRLQGIRSVRLKTIEHTALTEQSYRQDPFITSYERGQNTLDLSHQRVLREAKLTWPEAGPNQAEIDSTWVAGPEGCVRRTKDGDSPCQRGDLLSAREMLALGPESLLMTAFRAADLHFEAPAVLRSTLHAVVAFSWQKVPVRVLLNEFNHLPDAVETKQEFPDFWYFWGDVQQRVYLDNWQLFGDVV